MSMLSQRLVLLLFLLAVFPAWPLPANSEEVRADLESLVNAAMANNPEIGASEQRWQASLERARQAGALEDPMLMLRIQNGLIRDPFDFSRESMTSKVIGLSQKVPYYGKRELMRAEAELEAEAERWEVEERRIELRRMVKETWYQLSFIDRSKETVEANIALLDDLNRLAESMYGVGKAGQQDVFRAQLERSKMEEMRISLEQKRRSLLATLNTLVFQPLETELATIARVEMSPLLTLSPPALEAMALANRPAVKALEARIERTAVSRKVAEKDFYPDFTLSFEYMQRDPAMETPGDDMYGAGISFNLPVQRDRRHARVAEVRAENLMASRQLEVLKNQMRQAIGDGLARLERSQRLTTLYDEGLFAQASGTVEAAMAAYRTDKATFTEVLESRMALFNFEREYHEAVAEHQMVLAALEGVVGAPLDR